MSDIEEFNDYDVDEKTIIAPRISKITEFVDNNNVEMNNLFMYKRYCKQLNIIKYDAILTFKMNIALGLLKARKDKVKTRKSLSLTPPSNLTTKKYKKLNVPFPVVRFSAYQHWPEYTKDKKRCNICVLPYSRTKCFKSYHEK